MNPLRRQQSFTVTHASDIATIRRHARQLTDLLGFGETQAGQLAIVITELATNILKHAEHGVLIVTPVMRRGHDAVEILALDQGKGIGNLTRSLRDGISTAGTAGNGLGAVRRLSQEFDVYSVSEKGAAFFACIHNDSDAPDRIANFSDPHEGESDLQYGAVCIPITGEEECGDAWALERGRDNVTMMVADGLGHGPEAAVASAAAVKAFRAAPGLEPGPAIEAMHQTMRATRGAAVAVGKLNMQSGMLRFAGIGNIAATVIDGNLRKQLVSHNGIVGNNMRKVQEFEQPWPAGVLYIMCSDGIATQWDMSHYPGLPYCHPSLIAGVLYRDHARGRDDATVLVVKYNHHASAA